MKKQLYLILHNIRSSHNAGSCFRTADGAAAAKIFLTGYTGKPLDKFSRVNKEIKKTALGAEENIPWEYHKNISPVIEKLKRENVFVVALEQSLNAIDYKTFQKKYKKKLNHFAGIALIVGNEVRGLSSQILKQCGATIEIPMAGRKESLNAAVACGIALFELRELF
ncbi:MAG: TrmH family RNA methyltransferase [Candidatus Niyogibacteria bacterium]|nr:TrmH family RNA methyltransferase [Candidatus Niyogibacteria bacterium]